jgi:hypothetical protein
MPVTTRTRPGFYASRRKRDTAYTPPSGNSVVSSVCRKHCITLEEFFGPRRIRKFSLARKEAIERLFAKGMTLAACARLIGRDKSTIAYWLHPEWRERKRASMRRYRGLAGREVRG